MLGVPERCACSSSLVAFTDHNHLGAAKEHRRFSLLLLCTQNEVSSLYFMGEGEKKSKVIRT